MSNLPPNALAAYNTLLEAGYTDQLATFAFSNISYDSETLSGEIMERAIDFIAENAEEDDYSDESSETESVPHKVVICVREDLNMSAGKVAAQSGHAIHLLCRGCHEGPALEEWEEGDSGSAIIALAVKDLDQLEEIRRKCDQAHIPCFPVIDAGRTEVEEGTCTVMAVGPATNEQLKPITGSLRLFK